MTADQAAKMMKLDAQIRATHQEEMRSLGPPICDPNLTPVVRLLKLNQP
jgi:hypothetical protein